MQMNAQVQKVFDNLKDKARRVETIENGQAIQLIIGGFTVKCRSDAHSHHPGSVTFRRHGRTNTVLRLEFLPEGMVKFDDTALVGLHKHTPQSLAQIIPNWRRHSAPKLKALVAAGIEGVEKIAA